MTERKFTNLWNFVIKQFKSNSSSSRYIVNQELSISLQEKIKEWDKSTVNKIGKILDDAYEYDKSDAKDIECCICYDDNKKFVSLICKHDICVECFELLKKRGFKKCPYCKQKINVVKIHKKIALIKNIQDEHYGIVYFPPINIQKKESDHEIFPYLVQIPKNKRKFNESLINIEKNNYAILFDDENVKNMLTKHFSNTDLVIIE